VRSLDTQTPQVLVEARIVEATSTFSRDVGIQWGGDLGCPRRDGQPHGPGLPERRRRRRRRDDPNSDHGGSLGDAPASRTRTSRSTSRPPAAPAGRRARLHARLDRAATQPQRAPLGGRELNGVLRIVSSPRILTLDNREATIAQGTLIPYSQVSAQGIQTAFQEAKLQLRVRPHVTADGSISMHVSHQPRRAGLQQHRRPRRPHHPQAARPRPTCSSRTGAPRSSAASTPATPAATSKACRAGDIPILGALFQRRRQSDERSELLIFITPRIVNRAESLGR
jgi:type IV pilus assembly protein PilQ